METMPKEIRLLFESLQSTMLQILDLSPDGWYWVVEAQRRVLEMQVQTFLKRVG